MKRSRLFVCCGLSGQILQVVRAPNGAQYIIQQPQQQILLQQQMQPGGVQAPVIQQVRPITQVGTPNFNELGAGKWAWIATWLPVSCLSDFF